MSIGSDIFLISSPLQAVVADAIVRATPSIPRNSIIFFVEDERLADCFADIRCVALKNTRLVGRRHIAENLQVILPHIDDPATLWVSDILWPMNNAAFTALGRQQTLKQVNFFDEGMVLYWQEHLTFLNGLRERAKFAILARRLGVAFTTPAAYPFYDNARNGSVYALHPQLLSGKAPVNTIDIDLRQIEQIGNRLEGMLDADTRSSPSLPEGSALVLSQPYYRVADPGQFKAVVAGLARHLRERGHGRLFVKLHPSEGAELFDRFYRDVGFEIAFPDMKSPVEVILQHLPKSCTLASFNSSALLNARKFGFEGHILSYGLNWIAAQYPLRRNMATLTRSLFERGDLEVVLA